MANESARKIAFGFGKEVTPGTTVAPGYWVKNTDADFHQMSDKDYDDANYNVLDKYSDAQTIKDYGSGKVAGNIGDRSFPLIMAAAAGAAPVTTTNADASGTVRDHTINQSQSNEPLSLTLGLKDLNRDERYAMGRLTSLEITAELGKKVKYTSTWLTKKPAASAGNTVAFTAENEFKAKYINAKLAAAIGGLGAGTAANMKSLKLTITPGTDGYQAFGSTDLYNIFREETEITGEFVFLFDSLTHRDAFLNNTMQAMRIDMVNTDVTIGTAANPRFKIDLAKINFMNWTPDQTLGNKMVEQTVSFRALYSLADGFTWQALFTNLVTSY